MTSRPSTSPHPNPLPKGEGTRGSYDAVVIGSGPNGFAAAITIARAGRSVLLVEGADTLGGATGSAELTLPEFVHDVCASVMALVPTSPFFTPLLPELARHGVQLLGPPVPFAHPFDDGTAAVAERSVDATAARLGPDGDAYRRLIGPLVDAWPRIVPDVLGPMIHLPRHPLGLARFGLHALRSAKALCEHAFHTTHARGLVAGAAAHSVIPLDQTASASFALVLTAAAHLGGWPVVRGGSQRLSEGLASILRSLGGEVVTGMRVRSLDELPPSRVVLCDVTPKQLLDIGGDRLPAKYRRKLDAFRYGPGVFKIDYALSAPIPWKAADCARAGTVHLGGTLDEIADAEAAPWRGEHAPRPFVLMVQQTIADPSRAPAGRHTAWAYCHVPNGSTFDMTQRIEDQIERFAPGFRDVVLERRTRNCEQVQASNPNLIGGDIGGGANDLAQLVARPVLSTNPYATPVKGLYLCSSSTPPGGGVHGMCGYLAARSALRELR